MHEEELLEAFSTLDIVLLNSGDRPTYTKGDASSIVDLTFVSTSLAKGSISWVVLDIYTASDHHAILWETSKDRNLRGPIKQKHIEDHTKALMMRVTQACDASMPRKRVYEFKTCGTLVERPHQQPP
ncbi:hypothetical protein EVAR_65489_1 [Eumeta japonica]|uniref:Endonuclease/exonuclease/phosphatase domain-containing protein n=1 Tax=Eumeta variegata TaxID=151549 RepID=A0A4C2A519_EUMVA|nr:hypothetical protein EVAR_65489_1 [Eumeta japonica]